MYKRGNYTKSLSLIVEEFSAKYGYCSPLFSDYIKKYELSECKLQTREMLDVYLEEVYDFVVYGKGMLPNTRGKFSESDKGKYIYLSTNKKSMSYLRGYLFSNFSNFGDYVHEVVTSSRNIHDYYIENLIASGHTFEED